MDGGSVEQNVTQQAVAVLRQNLGDKLVAVVLFGSRARDEALEDSDWDLLVIADQLPRSPLERHRVVREPLKTLHCHEITIIAHTREEFESSISPLYLDIAFDGVILFDRDDYVALKLAHIRHLAENAGFFRYRSQAGDIWLPEDSTHYQPLSWNTIPSAHATQS
jgi:predicted nucleotidyltransferase